MNHRPAESYGGPGIEGWPFGATGRAGAFNTRPAASMSIGERGWDQIARRISRGVKVGVVCWAPRPRCPRFPRGTARLKSSVRPVIHLPSIV